MPELPEVETICTSLAGLVIGLTIETAEILHPGVIKLPEPAAWPATLAAKKITGIRRHGKYLHFFLDGGLAMVIHLRMTGRLVYVNAGEPRPRHTHVVFCLDNGNQLRFIDSRRFGALYLVPEGELDRVPGLKTLGAEPLAANFTADVLGCLLTGKKRPIKALLLDQTLIAGIGNIYADEVLAEAGLLPQRPAGSLTADETKRLYGAVRQVLGESIANRGTTFRDYVDGLGQKGGYQEHLRVYQRVNQPCRRCGELIIRQKLGGRSSFYCPACQK